jgi:phosphatidate cytidylyltransferase
MIAAWIIVSVYFVIGAIATAIINKKKPEGGKQRWTKYIVYLLIVFAIMTIIRIDWFLWAAFVVCAIGQYEVIRIGKGNIKRLVIGLVVYVLVVIPFMMFAASVIWPVQLLIYVIVLTFDGFSQITGQLFGKRKLTTEISPGKTVEGLIGGSIMAVLTAVLINYYQSLPANVALGINISIAALIGDLLASFYKRTCKVKDYSNLVPGHGGVLDRFDSLIFVGAYWYVSHYIVR